MTERNQYRDKQQSHWSKFYPVIIILIGFLVRFLTYTHVFGSNRIVFLETDPYYHMWRVFSYIDIFPGTFLFEPYINYPYGALVGWPPLFDESIALISLIIGLGKPGPHLVESVGVLMPVFLGVFSIISIYYIAKEIFNKKIALYSSLLLAVIPAHTQVSFLGFTDHHIAEVLISVLVYLFFIKSLEKGSHLFAVISGIAMGSSFLIWIGAPIFTGILLAYAVIQFILDKKHNAGSNYLKTTGVVSFLTAFFFVSIFYLWTPWQQTITSGTLSYFQPIYLAAAAAAMFFLGSLSNLMKNKKWYYYPLSIIILSAFLFLLLIIAIPSFYESISGGVGYLLREGPVLKQINEAQPLFYTYDGTFLGWHLFSNPVWFAFTFSFYTALIGLLWFLYSCEIDKGRLFLIVWTLIILALTLSQRRFTYMFSINVAILSGFLIYKLKFYIDAYIDKLKSFHPDHIVLALVLFIFIIPNLWVVYDLSGSPPGPSPDWYDSLVWLKENTPDTGTDPQYGIMTWWDYGNWILYISKRPVVSNNFQIGGDEAARFFTAGDEELANSIMDRRKARYVVVDRRMGLNKFVAGDQFILKGTFFAVADFADKDIGFYLNEYNLPNANYFQTIYARMHVLDGNGLKKYRLVYESNETHFNLFGRPDRNIKIFEYLKGAKVTGEALPGEIIFLSGTIISNQKRLFNYTQKIKADEKGKFEFVVPYSNNGPYETRLLNDYKIRFEHDNSILPVTVSESDVLNGNTIMVDL